MTSIFILDSDKIKLIVFGPELPSKGPDDLIITLKNQLF